MDGLATYDVHTLTISEYAEYFDTLEGYLNSLKTALEESFAEAANAATGLQVGEKAKEMYGIPEKIELIDDIIAKVQDYKTWLAATNQRKIEEDKARAEEYTDGNLPPVSSDTPPGSTQDGNPAPSSVNTPSDNSSSNNTGGSITPENIVPQVTTPPGMNNGDGSNVNPPSVTVDDQNGGSQNGNGVNPENIDPGTPAGGSQTGSGWDPNTINPNGNNNGTTGNNPFGNGNNYGTNGHSIGGSLANSTAGNGLGYGNGLNGSAYGAGAAAGLAASGNPLDGNSTGKSSDSFFDHINELTSGASLDGFFKNGLGANGGRFGSANGGVGGSTGDMLGTLAKAGIAIGVAGAGAGIYAGARTKYYIFDQDDWESLVPSDRDLIINKFLEVELLDAEIETFRTATFRIKADILDDPAKKIEKAYKQDPKIQEDIIQKYTFDIFTEKGQVDRYLLYILMIIDGHSTISEYNIYGILNDYLEEEIDLLYSGLQMEDFITEDNEEESVPEEAEAY